MSRSFKDFQDGQPRKAVNKKASLRYGARDAYRHFSGDNPEKSKIFSYTHPGRGASGESSN